MNADLFSRVAKVLGWEPDPYEGMPYWIKDNPSVLFTDPDGFTPDGIVAMLNFVLGHGRTIFAKHDGFHINYGFESAGDVLAPTLAEALALAVVEIGEKG